MRHDHTREDVDRPEVFGSVRRRKAVIGGVKKVRRPKLTPLGTPDLIAG